MAKTLTTAAAGWQHREEVRKLPGHSSQGKQPLASEQNVSDENEILMVVQKILENSFSKAQLKQHFSLYNGDSTVAEDISTRCYEMGVPLEATDLTASSCARDLALMVENRLAASRGFSMAYWANMLDGASQTYVPPGLVGRRPMVTGDPNIAHSKMILPLSNSKHLACGLTSLIRAAWIIILSRYFDANDVCFGTSNSWALDAQENISPMRFHIDKRQLKSDFLRAVERRSKELVIHRLETSHIATLSPDAENACNWSSVLRIHASERIYGGLTNAIHPQQDSKCPFIVDASVSENLIIFHITYYANVIGDWQVQRMCGHLKNVLQDLMSESNISIGDISIAGEEDIQQSVDWNQHIFSEKADFMIHDQIFKLARSTPKHDAVDAWDGVLTYEQLEELSSSFANELTSRGVHPGKDMIPICFEKSKWYIVGVLGILKAGAAFVPLDPSHPKERLKGLIQELDTSLVITSSKTAHLFTNVEGLSVVALPCSPKTPSQTLPSTFSATLKSPAYVIYTSGSTGKPKGIVMQHEALSASMLALIKVMNLDKSSRVLQFSSHIFDISIFDIFATLLAGGTICIPCEADRLQNLGTFTTSKRVEIAILTPSFVETLDPDEFNTLKTLGLVGEPVTIHNVRTWFGKVDLINTYGPAETCVISAAYHYRSASENPGIIGQGFHQRCWIVDSGNPHRLAPVGCVGELLIEGPMALGYLQDIQKTQHAFLDDVKWLPSAKSRFYRTGDLARYLPDGTIECLGRRDTQVKLRGQRTELGEIEHVVRNSLPEAQQIVVDVVKIRRREVLVAFASFASENFHRITETTILSTEAIDALLADAPAKMKRILPQHMIPTLFVPISSFPVTLSLKIDKAKLRTLVTNLSEGHLAAFSSEPEDKLLQAPLESKLRMLWAEVLGVLPNFIDRNDRFLEIGGDSFAAIRLVALARENGLVLAVASIFNDIPLYEMATTITKLSKTASKHQEKPFRLLDEKRFTSLQDQIRSQCNLSEHDVIQDAYPCTPLQEGFMSLSLKQPGSYIDRHLYRLSSHIDIVRFEAAWRRAISQYEALRTRIVHVDGMTYQVVIRHDDAEVSDTSLIRDDLKMSYGTRLSRWALEKDSDGHVTLIWVLHHAISDGWSKNLLLRNVYHLYNGIELPSSVSYSAFVEYVQDIDYAAAQEYWKNELLGATPAKFPSEPFKPDSDRHEARLVKKRVQIPKRGSSNITKATLIRAAWAILLAQYCETNDICFGETTSGRQAELPGLANIFGLAIAAIPVRIILDPCQSVVAFLQKLQRETVEMMAFEQHGLQNIARSCPDAKTACKFRNFLIIQAESLYGDDLLTEISTGNVEEAEQGYFTHPLNVEATLTTGDDVDLRLVYHSDMMNERQVNTLCYQIEYIAQQLASVDDDFPVGELSVAGPQDLQQYSQAAGRRPMTESCVHWEIMAQIEETPCRQAIEAWDQNLTYAELGRFSTILAGRLTELGAQTEELVLFCVSKSSWAAIAMVATQIAGAAFVPIDPCPTEERLRNVIQQTGARLALVSKDTEYLFREYGIRCLVVESQNYEIAVPTVQTDSRPDHISWITFTSGSTGQPKGIVMQHDATCSAANAMGWAIGKSPGVRVFQFSAYTFDAGVLDTLVTLMRGGCVCIPSEDSRKNDLAGAITSLRANFVTLTPSVAGFLKPEDVPTLEKMALTGEAVTQAVVDRWQDHIELIGTYGPAETSVCSWNSSIPQNGKPWNIGKPLSSAFWVVNPDDPDTLVPVGCVGELVIHGVLLARGYLNKSSNAEKWIKVRDEWLIPGLGSRAYQSGDLVRLNHDGSYDYLGRRDTQVKINGQRTELAEIELQIQKLLPAGFQNIVEYTKDEDVSPYLLAYIYNTISNAPASLPAAPTYENAQLTSHIYSTLSSNLPLHMVPSVFLPLSGQPERSVAGKIDRKRLAAISRQLSIHQRRVFSASYTPGRQPSTAMELRLCELWSQVLNIELKKITCEDNFMHLGGDSVSAMRLVMLSRKRGVEIKVQTVFQAPQLQDMALASKWLDAQSHATGIAPFAQISSADAQFVRDNLQALYGSVEPEDIFPCNRLQEGVFALSVKQPGSYVARFVYKLANHVELPRFLIAWNEVVRRFPNFRTVILQAGDCLLQAILPYNEATSTLWKTAGSNDLRTFLASGVTRLSELGNPLWEAGTFEETAEERYFALRIHHAAFDGWTLDLMLETLDKVYSGHGPRSTLSLAGFNHSVRLLDSSAASDFWRTYLQGSQPVVFPASSAGTLGERREVFQTITLPPLEDKAVTKANILTSAWALLLSRYGENNDVCFGTTLSGRGASVPGLDVTVGPTIATVPMRVRIDESQDTKDFLMSVQEQVRSVYAYEQFGLANITAVSEDARAACSFANLFVIQSPSIDSSTSSILTVAQEKQQLVQKTSQDFIDYALVVELLLEESSTVMRVEFNSDAIGGTQVTALCHHFQRALEQLMKPGVVRDISLVSDWDLKKAASRNTEELSPFDVSIYDLISKQIKETPEKEAIFSTSRSISYAELDTLTTKLAAHLQELGVSSEVIVPYCFEKSIWAVVSAVSIIKAGGAFMPMDARHPYEYRKKLVQQVDAKVTLASPTTAPQCEGLTTHVIPVSSDLLERLIKCKNELSSVETRPNSPVYVIFSSGSTGTPKGIIIENRAFASALRGHSRRYNINHDTRFFHFSSYVFDVACMEILTILSCGATLCIPTEEERLEQTARFITVSRSDMTFLSPSFARTLDPELVPNLKTLLIGGEAPTADVVQSWAGKVRLINAYGPAEDSVYSVTHQYIETDESPATIGTPINNAAWVVDIERPNKLAPIGCVGELVLQGPAIARGYVDTAQNSTASFSTTAEFLSTELVQKCPRFYATGDLVRYLENGDLIYVGRRDTQAKLRGQRIELGEIEAKILRVDSTTLHVAVEVFRQPAHEALVAFICFKGSSSNDDKQIFTPCTASLRDSFSLLSEKLSHVLPPHMVPTYYFSVENMPYTSSGKIDRKLLKGHIHTLPHDKLLTHTTSIKRVFRACSNEVEKQIRLLWANTLGLESEKISVDDNFYDIGGDSIRIVTLVKRLRDKFNFQLSLHLLNSRNTTIEVMAGLINSHLQEADILGAKLVDFCSEIDNVLQCEWVKTVNDENYRHITILPNDAVVFLTGGTGFLGTQLLRQLLSSSQIHRVVSLVRAKNADHGLQRLERSARVAGWWSEHFASRIEIWTGDLAAEQLGLREDQWQRLCGHAPTGNIDAIIHNGATVNWNADYERLRLSNVDSTVALLEAAVKSRCAPKFVFVSGGTSIDAMEDRRIVAAQMATDIGYCQTKFVAESIVRELALRLPPEQNRFSVIKPGLVIGTETEGVSNTDDFVWRIVAASSQMKLCPSESDEWMSIADGAFVASQIISQTSRYEIKGFDELSAKSGLPTREFWELVNGELGVPCTGISWNDWVKEASAHMNQVGEAHPLWAVQHFLLEENSIEPSPPCLEPSGHENRDTLYLAIKKNVQYLQTIGFVQSGLEKSECIVEDVFRR